MSRTERQNPEVNYPKRRRILRPSYPNKRLVRFLNSQGLAPSDAPLFRVIFGELTSTLPPDSVPSIGDLEEALQDRPGFPDFDTWKQRLETIQPTAAELAEAEQSIGEAINQALGRRNPN